MRTGRECSDQAAGEAALRRVVLGEEPVAPPGGGGVGDVGWGDVDHAGVGAEAGAGLGTEGLEHGSTNALAHEPRTTRTPLISVNDMAGRHRKFVAAFAAPLELCPERFVLRGKAGTATFFRY